MFESGKENPFSALALQKQKFFFLGEIEGLHDERDGRGRLLEEYLQGGIGDDGFSVRRVQKVAHVLRDGGERQKIFARPLRDAEEKRRAVRIFHEPPRLVHDQEPFFQRGAHFVPNIAQNQEYADGAQLVLHVAHGKPDKAVVHLYIRRLVDEARPCAGRVFTQAHGKVFPARGGCEHQFQVRERRRRYARKVRFGRDVARRVCLGNRGV